MKLRFFGNYSYFFTDTVSVTGYANLCSCSLWGLRKTPSFVLTNREVLSFFILWVACLTQLLHFQCLPTTNKNSRRFWKISNRCPSTRRMFNTDIWTHGYNNGRTGGQTCYCYAGQKSVYFIKYRTPSFWELQTFYQNESISRRGWV